MSCVYIRSSVPSVLQNGKNVFLTCDYIHISIYITDQNKNSIGVSFSQRLIKRENKRSGWHKRTTALLRKKT